MGRAIGASPWVGPKEPAHGPGPKEPAHGPGHRSRAIGAGPWAHRSRPTGRSTRPCQPSPDWGTGLIAWFTTPINPVLR